jgi:predicted PurR-regulated permease PerM
MPAFRVAIHGDARRVPEMRRSDSTRALSQLVILVALIAAVTALYVARVVLVPFSLAILFAFLLTPIVRILDRIHIPRVLSSLAVVAVAVAGLGLLGWAVTGQLVDVANQLPAYRSNVKRKIASVYDPRNQSINKAANALDEISKEIVSPGTSPVRPVPGNTTSAGGTKDNATPKPLPVQVVAGASNPLESLGSVVGPVSIFGIVTIFTLFMLMRREDLRNRFIRLVGYRHLSLMTQALDDASHRVSRYLFLQLSVNAAYGLIIGAGLYFIGIPHVLLWGVVAALLRFVPYVGSFISAALPIVLSIAMFDGWAHALLTLGLYVAAEMTIANVVEPLLYAAHVGLSSLAILVAAVFWTVLWGPVGLVLSTPLTVCLAVMGRYVPNLGFLSILLGDDPVLSPESHYYQRLLASDQHEAKRVLEEFLKENGLIQLYDSVLIPALALAEQDRHHDDLDDATQKFISLNTREFIEELFERNSESANAILGYLRGKSLEQSRNAGAPGSMDSAGSIVCIPAGDDADEIVCTMLTQLLERIGQHPRCIPLGSFAESAALIEAAHPQLICISALSPLAVSDARNLYVRFRTYFPKTKMLVGLWAFSGDRERVTERMRLADGDRVFFSLEAMLAEIVGVKAGAAEPFTETSETADPAAVVQS